MKKILLIIIIAVLIIALITGGVYYFLRTRETNIKTPKKPVSTKPLDFKSISLSENNCSAIEEVYEIEKNQNGVKLSRIYENISNDERQVIREFEGDNTLLEEIQNKLGAYGVESWDGFHGANPKDILDGSSMRFSCTMSDGRKLSAYGSNNFPDNYGAVRNYISDLLRYETLKETKFVGECYEITLPESWVSKVKVSFDEGYNAFLLPVKDKEILLMRVSFTPYEYNDKSQISRIIKGKDSDEELCFAVLNYNTYMSADDGTEEEYKIYESFKNGDFKKITDSIKLIKGYEFTEE